MKHVTVLLKEAIDGLNLKSGDVMIDGTLGAGGHVQEVCDRFGQKVTVLAFDLDSDAIGEAKERFLSDECNVVLHQANFKDMDKILKEDGRSSVNAVLLDLGYSFDQLESGGRGLSFQKDEPLKMTLKKEISESEFDASDIVNTWDEEDIANVIYAYGEERFARRIAKEIIEEREKSPIKTTTDLIKIIEKSVPIFYKHSRLNPATKTFQALRIAVNDELQNLQTALQKGFDLLSPDGRFAVITFHSLEDRIVKNFFRDKDHLGEGSLLYKKPIIPSSEEQKNNPKSRSAKLRIIKKI